jgi:O-methyltransferase involved in polyketide biosynthesis
MSPLLKQKTLVNCIDAKYQSSFVAANNVCDAWEPLLTAHGFDPESPTFVIWEGNVENLTRPMIERAVNTINSYIKSELRIVLDYFKGNGLVDCATTEPLLTELTYSFNKLATWTSYYDDIDRELAKKTDFRLVDDQLCAKVCP